MGLVLAPVRLMRVVNRVAHSWGNSPEAKRVRHGIDSPSEPLRNNKQCSYSKFRSLASRTVKK